MNRMRNGVFLASVFLVVSALGVMPRCGWGSPTEPAEKAKPHAVVEVITVAPGMSAAAIEKNITTRLERRVGEPVGVRTIRSRSIAGVSIIDIVFHEDVDPITALAQVQSVIQGDLDRLPSNTRMPVVMLRPPLSSSRWEEHNARRVAGMMTLTSNSQNDAILRAAAEIAVRLRLLTVPGLMAPVTLGGKDSAVVFTLKPPEMEARGLSVRDVEMALRKAVRPTTALGSIVLGDNHLLLKGNNEKARTGKEIDELLALPIRPESDTPVLLRDIAEVHDAYPVPTSVMRIDRRRGVCLPIYFAKAGDEEIRKERIKKALTVLPKDLLRDIKLDWVSFNVPRKDGRPDDDGLLTIRLRAPSKLRLEAVEKRVMAVDRFLQEHIPAKERLAILTELGVRADVSAAYTSNAGQQDTTIRVLLSEDRTRSAGEYARRLRSQFFKEPAFADLTISFAASDLPRPVAIRVRGGNPEQATKLTRAVFDQAQRIVGAIDVFVVERLDAPCLVITVDRDKAVKIGLTQADVLSEVRAALPVNSPPLVSLKAQNFPMPLLIRYPEQPDLNMEDVLQMAVVGKNRTPVKLGSLVSFRRTAEAVEIHHVDATRVFNVRVGIENRDRREVIADIRKMIEKLQVPEGMKVELVDE